MQHISGICSQGYLVARAVISDHNSLVARAVIDDRIRRRGYAPGRTFISPGTTLNIICAFYLNGLILFHLNKDSVLYSLGLFTAQNGECF